jgi:tetratricopeptide (TPR) repeat protein
MHRLRAVAAAPAPDAREARRTYVDALVERIPALAEGLANAPLARLLRRAGVTDATAERAAAVLSDLDVAAFSAGNAVSRELAERALAVARAVDAEAVRPASVSRAARAVLLVALGLAATGAAALQLRAAPEPLGHAFADGVAAYQRGDFSTAERLFARVSARVPRAPDAWANLGTAAWARGDSALAAVGWQRALRLEPLDTESRSRFDAIQATSFGDAAYVPPVPVDVAAGAALAVWLAAWLLLALPASRRSSLARAGAGGAMTLSLLLLGAAFELQSRADVRGLGALRTARTLLEAPASDAPSLAAATAGEVGAFGAREGAWVRIALDGERSGWVPVAAVIPLDNPVH